MEDTSKGSALYWDSSFAIAMALMAHHPEHRPEDIGLVELEEIVQALPGFIDDPALVNERLLIDIQTVWYEEMTDL